VNLLRKLKRAVKYNLFQLLRIKKGAHQVALGFVTGFFPCWFPTFGAGAALSIGITKLIRGNILASIISAGLGSILWPVLFFMNFKVGGIWGNLKLKHDKTGMINDITQDEINVEYLDTVDNINNWNQLGIEFLVGSIINSILFTTLGYFLIMLILQRYRSALLLMMRRKSANGKSKR